METGKFPAGQQLLPEFVICILLVLVLLHAAADEPLHAARCTALKDIEDKQ
jgi:hypothetical protein